jgi:hypothetical protein
MRSTTSTNAASLGVFLVAISLPVTLALLGAKKGPNWAWAGFGTGTAAGFGLMYWRTKAVVRSV